MATGRAHTGRSRSSHFAHHLVNLYSGSVVVSASSIAHASRWKIS